MSLPTSEMSLESKPPKFSVALAAVTLIPIQVADLVLPERVWGAVTEPGLPLLSAVGAVAIGCLSLVRCWVKFVPHVWRTKPALSTKLFWTVALFCVPYGVIAYYVSNFSGGRRATVLS